MTETLTIDDLTIEIRRSARRKSLEITVDRQGELVVAVPDNLEDSTVARFVRDKREWVYRKLAEKQMFQCPRTPRQFVTGEGFQYLGRNYRLKLVDRQDCPLKLTGGRFCLRRDEVKKGRSHFIEWYKGHGEAWVNRRLPAWAERMGVRPGGVRILDLGHRWGSCSSKGVVNVHWTTMQLPAAIIDYILIHELAHLLEPRHGAEFWALLERAMPDYERLRQWLAEQGKSYAGI